MTTAEARDTAIREAKRYIRDVVRNDWCFEPSTSTTGPRFETSWPVSEQEVAEWRLRGYDDSGSELEPQDEDEDFDESTPPPAAGERDNERRRKRRRQMEEEMSWNEGLRTWMERRDAWAGARTRREIQERENRLRGAGGDTTINATASAAAANGAEARIEGICDEASALAASMDISFAITEKNEDNEEGKGQQLPQPQPQPAQPTETNVTESEQPLEPSQSPHSDNHLLDQKASSDIPDEPFIPVVPSIISNTNPIRASISPNMYPSIYSKVIVQSLTPTVPINLADVTKAMVQGWKADGQWPTKPAPTSIVLPDDATVRRKDDAEARRDKTAAAQDTKKKSGVASAVRKVLHFSGFHPHHHPFHRRGSNHSGSNSQHDGAGTGTGASAGAGAGANGATEPGHSNAQ